jgi:hypothetical protein
MTRRSWHFFFDKRAKVRKVLIIWEALARVFKVVYTVSTQIGTALGTLTKASVQYAYSILVKTPQGKQIGAKAQATYAGTSAMLKGRAFGLTARAVYAGTSATLKGRPYGLTARAEYSAQAKFGARLGTSARTSYTGTTATLKGRPTGFGVQARYTATSRQSATSGTKFGTTASYSASAVAQINPTWLPKFSLATDKDLVNTFPGASYSITFTVANIGGIRAQAEVSVWDVDGTLKDQFTVALDPNASYSKTISFTAPLDPGTYYVTAQVKNLFTNRIDDAASVQVNVAQSQ